jgi:tetratricopeptide (TPR) repeat protein
MSRFANLEFDQHVPAGAEKAQGEPIRDRYFFAERAALAWLSADFEGALRYYSQCLEDDHTYYPGWFGQVRMLIELCEYPEAIIWADKSLEMFPAHHELLASKAIVMLRQGNQAEAQSLSDDAISEEGASYYVWIARAEVLLARKLRTAESCIQNALSIAGNDISIARLEAGRTLTRWEAYGTAMPILTDAARDLPESALAWYELGRCQSALGFPEAEATLAQCIKLRPNWAEAESALNNTHKRGLFSWLRKRR